MDHVNNSQNDTASLILCDIFDLFQSLNAFVVFIWFNSMLRFSVLYTRWQHFEWCFYTQNRCLSVIYASGVLKNNTYVNIECVE